MKKYVVHAERFGTKVNAMKLRDTFFVKNACFNVFYAFMEGNWQGDKI